MNRKKVRSFFKRNLWRIIIFALLIVLLIVISILKKYPYICEYYLSRGFARDYTAFASSITSLVPFSITEWVYLLIAILAITFLVLLIIDLVKKRYSLFFKTLYGIVTVVFALVVFFNYTYVASFYREPVENYLNLPNAEMSLESCKNASIYYSDMVNSLAEDLSFDENGDVISPYTFQQLSDIINEEMTKLDSGYFSPIKVNAKPVVMSKVMSYIGITGIYITFLGEANISTDIPAYQLPETIAHEIAHAKGVTKENEANYVAYYTLITSDNAYLKYCGLMYASVKMLNESYDSKDTSYYEEALTHFSTYSLTQYDNANAHWSSYDTFIDDIGDFFNNLYLKSSGQPSGIKSYSETGNFLLRLYFSLTA